MDPTTGTENQYQLAILDLVFATVNLALNVMLGIFGEVTTAVFTGLFDLFR
jgi:hypothetical protein